MMAQCPILLVDDDENDLYLLERALKSAGIENPLQIARNGQDAVTQLTQGMKAAQANGARLPRLMILDLKMPLMTGLDVLRWLREQPVLWTLPVIVFSSSAQRNDIERAYVLGANAFVVKPGSIVQRAEFARNVRSFWLDFAEPPLICSAGVAAAQRMHDETGEQPGPSS